MNRKELLLKQNFFENKENLVDTILLQEQIQTFHLPNDFVYKKTSPLTLNESSISVLRIENAYFLEFVNKTDSSSFKFFVDEIALRKFFIDNSETDEQLNFWLRQLNLICD